MIQMTNVVKRFGEQTVLTDVSFDVKQGEIFGLLGPSGAGKTTIINILTGQIKLDGGHYTVGASPLETGVLLDDDGLYPSLNCLENLDVFATIYGIPKSKVQKTLENVGLGNAAKKAVTALSKGMRQRLSIARAVLHEPKVLFLDEPTSALDPATARGIHELIRNLCKNGTTVFLTTHNMDEAVKLCDHIAMLHRGKIVEQGVPLEICQRRNAMKTVPDLESVFIDLTGEELLV